MGGMAVETVRNAAGRLVPRELDGTTLIPFKGAFSHVPPAGSAMLTAALLRPGDSKLLGSLEEAIKRSGLSDGMTISFHHHLRDGDAVTNMVMDAIARLGIKGLRLLPSALFPVHGPLIEHMRDGTIARIEGSMNGPVGDAVSHGILPHPAVLRSHGGRVRAIQYGEVHIDVAFIAAPAADPYGNANGVQGRNACGSLNYSRADAMFAKRVVIVTDNLQPYPVTPISISQKYIDYVVEVDSIGDHTKIVSGTTKITTDPGRLAIADAAAQLIEHSGYFRDGMSFQAGAGGISLAITKRVGDMLEDRKYVASFIDGGVTEYVVDIYKRGLVRKILNGQSFDIASIEDLRVNPDHEDITPDFYANIFNKGPLVNMLDVGVLGATEVDVDFNVNVNTHSDGRLLHGIGGHQDVAAGAKLTIITVPTYRKSNPIVMDSVTTITTPGETVDAIVTDQGVAINPRRKDLLKNLEGSPVKLVDIRELRDHAYEATGGKQELDVEDDIIGIIQYRDGTVIDVVKRVKGEM